MNEFIIPGTIVFVILITITVILGVWKFGIFLFEKKMIDFFTDKKIEVNDLDLLRNNNIVKLFTVFANLYTDFTDRRNDFWTLFGQILICIFIVCIIALLLLTKVISAESGLPILSAISGFAIAKSSTSKGTNKGINLTNSNNFQE